MHDGIASKRGAARRGEDTFISRREMNAVSDWLLLRFSRGEINGHTTRNHGVPGAPRPHRTPHHAFPPPPRALDLHYSPPGPAGETGWGESKHRHVSHVTTRSAALVPSAEGPRLVA